MGFSYEDKGSSCAKMERSSELACVCKLRAGQKVVASSYAQFRLVANTWSLRRRKFGHEWNPRVLGTSGFVCLAMLVQPPAMKLERGASRVAYRARFVSGCRPQRMREVLSFCRRSSCSGVSPRCAGCILVRLSPTSSIEKALALLWSSFTTLLPQSGKRGSRSAVNAGAMTSLWSCTSRPAQILTGSPLKCGRRGWQKSMASHQSASMMMRTYSPRLGMGIFSRR
mmetsp:Transcript_53458/g.95073  ORF Transcript_53458/g.95073 Transcript_53458/m.95073 type:complete len:226 (+) Transcript_53458:455-1132(+)